MLSVLVSLFSYALVDVHPSRDILARLGRYDRARFITNDRVSSLLLCLACVQGASAQTLSGLPTLDVAPAGFSIAQKVRLPFLDILADCYEVEASHQALLQIMKHLRGLTGSQLGPSCYILYCSTLCRAPHPHY